MGVMDGGEIKLVENKVIKIEVVAKLHHHKKKVVRGDKALIEEESLVARSTFNNSLERHVVQYMHF